MSPNPFAVLGLPERPDLDDETVRAAWRAIAVATHPDRADGGDLARYTQASAAFAELNTPWGRSEAYADLAERARRNGRFDDDDGEPGTVPLPVPPAADPLRPPAAPAHPRCHRGRVVGGGAGPDPRSARRPRRRRGPDRLVRADRSQ